MKVIQSEVKVNDNPFVKVSYTTKNILLMKKDENHINLRIFNVVKGVPYCDSFNIEENWLICAP